MDRLGAFEGARESPHCLGPAEAFSLDCALSVVESAHGVDPSRGEAEPNGF